ncbi:MAG: polysaccharide lyase [Rhodobacteraceae bacterium]|nr:polysaccharide lyase [Paracoccaceae bacterium]
MRKAVLMALALAALTTSTPRVDARRASYTDHDWNVYLYDNCGMPDQADGGLQAAERSVVWLHDGDDQQLRLKLDGGDVGGCRSDHKNRNGARFWERAELLQATRMETGEFHEVSFEAEFPEGFIMKRENFFQIHGWSKECPSAPIAMMQFDRGKLRLRLLRGTIEGGAEQGARPYRGDLEDVLQIDISISDLRNSRNKFRIIFDARKISGTISIWLNGESLVQEEALTFEACARPRIKLGIYRPGHEGNSRSVLHIDKVLVNSTWNNRSGGF